MQTCTRCNTQSPTTFSTCLNCGASLKEFSTTAVVLKKMEDNPRVKNIRLLVSQDACPACLGYEGTYEKSKVPPLPIEGCSHLHGCRCFYEPMLDEIYP